MVVHNLLHVSHNFSIASLGPGSGGIDGLAIGLENGGRLGVQYKRNG